MTDSGGSVGRTRKAASARSARGHPWRRGESAAPSVIGRRSGLVAADVRDERQVARLLDRRRELPLVARADAAQAARQDLAVVGDEAAERPVVLVVHEPHARLAERAGLLWAAHRLLLVLVVVLAPPARGGDLFLGHRRRAYLVLVERQQVPDDGVVEPERTLVLG